MEYAEHLTTLLAEGRALAATARRARWDAAVPSCPDWTVRDLVVHLGGVYGWAATIVGEARVDAPSREERAAFGEAPDDDGLADWFGGRLESVADAVARAEPSLSCYTLFPGRPGRDFWARRMAHETLVHRIDADLAAGDAPGPVDGAVALDGLAELVEDFLPVRGRRLVADPPRTLALVADEGAGWTVRIGPDGPVTTGGSGGRGPGGEDADGADLVLAGPAPALHLVAWNRAAPGAGAGAAVSAAGDGAVLDLWHERARI